MPSHIILPELCCMSLPIIKRVRKYSLECAQEGSEINWCHGSQIDQ